MWRRRKREQDLERELRADLELEAQEQRERGLSEEEARYAARRAMGNEALLKEDVRAAWGWTWIESCFQDLRFGSRMLTKSPGVTAAVVLTLALGLGATTALSSLLNALLYKQLPVPQAERLFVLQRGVGSDLDDSFTYPQFDFMARYPKPGVDLFAFSADTGRLQSEGIDMKVQEEFVSGDFFRILGVPSSAGRLFDRADEVRGSASSTVAVLSHRFWRSAFRGDPSVVGRKVRIDSVPFTIVGVTEPRFFGLEVGRHPDVWLPFAAKPALSPQYKMLECRGCYWLNIMARVKPGYGAAAAAAGLDVSWKNARRATMPETLSEWYRKVYFQERVVLAPGATGISGLREHFTRPLYVLLAMTAVILLIACFNIANLLTARAIARQRELAVRLSIGARRGRLIRQLLTESALLAAGGLAAGVAVYVFCIDGLMRYLNSGGTTYFLDTTPDLRFGALVSSLALATLGIFGLAPAIRATRWRLSGTLAGTSRAIASRSGLGRVATCGQLALSFALLVAAVLLARSLYDLRTFNAGFRRDHLLLISPDTSRTTLSDGDRLRRIEAVLSRVRGLPGVRSASASVVLPMEGSSWQREFTTPGYAVRKESDSHSYLNMVSPDFFRTLGTRLLLGRDFSDRDNETAPKAAIVNESFARRFWGAGNPLGMQFHELDKKEPVTVVGMVEDAKYRDFRGGAPPTAYLPLRQAAAAGWDLHLEVWSSADPHSLIAPARNLLNRDLPDVPPEFQTFTELIDQRLLYERMLTMLAVASGALAALICAVGIYGVAAYSVSRRTPEIGIRMALGATPGGVMGMVFREQAAVACVGLAAGAAGALLLTRFLRAWLFGVSPADGLSLVAGALALAAVTAFATLIPARRAAAIHPTAALRHE